MKKPYFACLMVLLMPTMAFSGAEKASWALEKSEITYTVTHPLHVVHGKSSSAMGKGVCYGEHCDFLVGVRVDSFDSGDQNRDLHMLEVTRAGLNPIIQVRAKTPPIRPDLKPKSVMADLEVDFAGKKVEFPKVRLDIPEWKDGEAHLTGGVTLSLKAFDITAPSLLTMPVQDAVPVNLNMFWRPSASRK